MQPIELTDSFAENKRRLAEVMGYEPDKDRVKLARLEGIKLFDHVRLIVIGPRSRVTLQLVHYLLHLATNTEIGDQLPELTSDGSSESIGISRDFALRFYGELADAPEGEHPTIDWFRWCSQGSNVEVTHFVVEPEEGMASAVERLNANPPKNDGELKAVRRFLREFVLCLTYGIYRAAEFGEAGEPIVHAWVKIGILLCFKHFEKRELRDGVYDIFDSRFTSWGEADYRESGIGRVALNVMAREGSHVEPGVILMLGTLVNVGARVGRRTMVDGGARIGSCAQIGEDCHIGGGAGIGGVLEPPQAAPVMLGNRVFVGPNTEIAEGVIVRSGAVITGGLNVTASIDILERMPDGSFKLLPRGEIPANAVVIGGSLQIGVLDGRPVSKHILIVAKRRGEDTAAKVALEEALRG